MAALAGDDARTAYAQIVLGAAAPADLLPGVKEQRRARAVTVLLDAGLIHQSGSRLEAAGTVFRDLLAQQPRQPKTGVDRFLRLGRIERYPASRTERRELLSWVAADAVRPGETLSERQVNERLLSYTNDVVLLRRYLVDFGLLERTPSGSAYSRPAVGLSRD
jgi:hypothetical protein